MTSDSENSPEEAERLRRRVAELETALRQQRETVDELRRQTADSETRFRNVFEYSNDTILLLDLDLDEILDINARGCRVFGYTRRELGSLPISTIFPRDMARLQAFALSVVADGYGWIDEVSCQTRTGETFAAEVSASEVPLGADRSCILVLLRDVTRRKAEDAEIRASLREKEVLLREIHHRVKNNLQVVTSLFDLQASRSQDPSVQSMLRECRNRVRSMSAIHESLYRAHDLSRVDFRRYITQLAEELIRSYGATTQIALQIDMDDVVLDVDQAIPSGLIVNELLSNALKYAYPDNGRGRIILRVVTGAELSLTVADDGVGLPADLDIAESPSLGLRLVHSLVDQLQGHIEVDRAAGTCFTILFAQRPVAD